MSLNRIGFSRISDRTKARRSARKKRYWAIALLLVLGCTSYWLKCEFGFNFFDSISISSYFPFNYLKNDVLPVKGTGIVIEENFDHFRIFRHWPDAAFHHNYKASDQVTEGGFGDHSRCLMINSEGNQHWAYPFSKYISVAQGDVFHFEGLVYLESDCMPARLCIAAFDENRKVINWGLAVQGTKQTGAWIKLQKQFTIANGQIRYITFRATGARGVYRLDNLLLSKVK